MRQRLICMAGIAGAFAIAACQPIGPQDDGESRVSAEGNAALPSLPNGDMPMPVEPDGGIGDTPGGPKPPAGPEAQDMAYADYSEAIPSGPSCGFTRASDKATLFVASAENDRTARAKGAIKIDGQVHVVTSTKAGGFERLVAGDILQGGGWMVNIGVGSGEGKTVGIETIEKPATLTVTRIGGGDSSYKGAWRCGA